MKLVTHKKSGMVFCADGMTKMEVMRVILAMDAAFDKWFQGEKMNYIVQSTKTEEEVRAEALLQLEQRMREWSIKVGQHIGRIHREPVPIEVAEVHDDYLEALERRKKCTT